MGNDFGRKKYQIGKKKSVGSFFRGGEHGKCAICTLKAGSHKNDHERLDTTDSSHR